MIIVSGFLVFLAIVGWAVLVIAAMDLSSDGMQVWVPVTFFGRFVKWSVKRVGDKVKLVVFALTEIFVLIVCGFLINKHWAFGLVPLALVLLSIAETLRVFKAERLVKQ